MANEMTPTVIGDLTAGPALRYANSGAAVAQTRIILSKILPTPRSSGQVNPQRESQRSRNFGLEPSDQLRSENLEDLQRPQTV
jgi:hypothetical protein